MHTSPFGWAATILSGLALTLSLTTVMQALQLAALVVAVLSGLLGVAIHSHTLWIKWRERQDPQKKRRRARLPVFLLPLLLLPLLPTVAVATDVMIQSTTISPWTGPTSGVQFWVYLSEPLTTPEGVTYQAGSPQNGVSVWKFNCSISPQVISGVTVYTLTIPTITLPATANAVVGSGSRYTAGFYTASGRRIAPYGGFESFPLPASTPITWAAIRLAYLGGVIQPRDASVFTRSEALSLFALRSMPVTGLTVASFAPGTLTGTGAKIATSMGSLTSGRCVEIDASGNFVQSVGPCGSGTGTVTSVGLSAPSFLSVSGSPVTSSGTLALALANQGVNTVFAGPSSAGPGVPAFRTLVAADLPNTAVIPGFYTAANITIDAQGRITSATGGTWTETDSSPSLTGITTFQVHRDSLVSVNSTTAKYAPTATLTYTFYNGGSVISTGVQGLGLVIPFDCTIESWQLHADQTGSIVLDLWRDSYANFPPTVADTITAAAKPSISSSNKNQSSSLTGWSASLTKGDVLYFNVDSVAALTEVVLTLFVRRH